MLTWHYVIIPVVIREPIPAATRVALEVFKVIKLHSNAIVLPQPPNRQQIMAEAGVVYHMMENDLLQSVSYRIDQHDRSGVRSDVNGVGSNDAAISNL